MDSVEPEPTSRFTASFLGLLCLPVYLHGTSGMNADYELCKMQCVVVVLLLFYVHGKHLRSCRDGQLT